MRDSGKALLFLRTIQNQGKRSIFVNDRVLRFFQNRKFLCPRFCHNVEIPENSQTLFWISLKDMRKCQFSVLVFTRTVCGIFTYADDKICRGPGSLFSEALTTLRHRFPFRKWQDKNTKEIMISQSEFAVKITKVPKSPARRKMREDPADKPRFMRFVVRAEVSVGWQVKLVPMCLNCNKPCHNQLWCRSVRRTWWSAECTSMPTKVSRSDECQYKA